MARIIFNMGRLPMTTDNKRPAGTTRRGVLKTLAAGAAVTSLPLWARYAQAQSSAPIRIGFQAHKTGIGAAYGKCSFGCR